MSDPQAEGNTVTNDPITNREPQDPSEVVAAALSVAANAVAHYAESHPSRAGLDTEMREVKDGILRMGSLVEESIRAAMAALVAHDAEAATRVIIGDGRINEMQRDVSGMITRAIATQSPVARDLRFLLSLDHVGYELERMGDHAASVAKQVRKLAPEPPLKRYIDLPAMGELAATLVGGILRALVDIDVDAARAVAVRDDEIDLLYHRTFDEEIGRAHV